MIEIQGQFNKAKIMADDVDESVTTQVYSMLNSVAFSNTNIVIMPDCHSGAGSVIGLTMPLNDYVIPNVVGVDIGCGIKGINLGKLESIDFEKLDEFIKLNIPSGFSRHQISDKNGTLYQGNFEACSARSLLMANLVMTCLRIGQDLDTVLSQLGTLGGGNHFIEIDKSVDGNYWLIIHSGSRNFGLKVANYFQKLAKDQTGQGELSYLGSDEFGFGGIYLGDMAIAQEFAKLNRNIMARRIVERFFKLDYKQCEQIESVHNYIATNTVNRILRKGAISAELGEKVLIPLNMAKGTIIGVGKGNQDWNYSAPHGAGRIMSRGEAKRSLDLDDYRSSMEGIYTSCINTGTIDEAPMAYKNADIIKQAIEPTVEILEVVKPVYNFKACEK